MKHFCVAKTLGPILVLSLIANPLAAYADKATIKISTEIISGSHLTDRGETLAAAHAQARISAAADVGSGVTYLAIGKIAPILSNAHYYQDEVGYSLGYVLEQKQWSFDLSVNRLVYTEVEQINATEFVIDATLNASLEPQLTAFYANETRDYGLEGRIGHTFDINAWSLSAAVLAGFVAIKNDTDRSYIGLETSLSRAFSESTILQGYAFITTADELSFAQSFSDSGQPKSSHQATGIGLRLSWIHD
jgi:hypothetical protein